LFDPRVKGQCFLDSDQDPQGSDDTRNAQVVVIDWGEPMAVGFIKLAEAIGSCQEIVLGRRACDNRLNIGTGEDGSLDIEAASFGEGKEPLNIVVDCFE